MTVRELIKLLTDALEMDDLVYVEIGGDHMQLEEAETNEYNWGFSIGKVDY